MRGPRQALIVGCALLICGMPAHAYLDPGTGSALIQGLIAGIAAVGVTLKLYWHRIVTFIDRRKKKNTGSLPDAGPEPQSKRPPP